MYSSRARDLAFSYDLQETIQREYQLDARLTHSPLRGFYGEIWELHGPDRTYIAKLDCSIRHQTIYFRNLPILPDLWQQGMRRIPQIVPTRQGALHLPFAQGTLVIFTFISGPFVPEAQFGLLYDTLAQLYLKSKPEALWRETFSPQAERDLSVYVSAIGTMPHQTAKDIHSILRSKLPIISRNAARLQHFAARCRQDASGFVLTHGDPRRNGILHDGQAYLIDWDDPLWAPPERDAWQFLDMPGALDQFQDALEQVGIHYRLRPERLAYYGYALFFQCLREILACFFDMLGELDPGVILEVLEMFFESPTIKSIHMMDTWT